MDNLMYVVYALALYGLWRIVYDGLEYVKLVNIKRKP